MRWFLYFGVLIVLVSCQRNEVDNTIEVISTSIVSKETQSGYKIKFALPKNMLLNDGSQIIFLLDANWYFDLMIGHLSQHAKDIRNGFVLVGIESSDNRRRDFTPSKTSQGGGGADNFIQFIKEELFPLTSNNFNIEIERHNTSIIGHSLGGLLVTYAFTNYTELFNNYFALSPSNWYDDGIMLKLEEMNKNKISQFNSLFFISVAEMEQTQIFNFQFYENLKNNYSNVKSTLKTIKRQNHSSGASKSFEKATKLFIEYL